MGDGAGKPAEHLVRPGEVQMRDARIEREDNVEGLGHDGGPSFTLRTTSWTAYRLAGMTGVRHFPS